MYYRGMFRTKDMFMVMVACVVIAMIIGLMLPKPSAYPQTVLPLGAPLTTAPYKDFYAVSLEFPEAFDDTRSAFIEKIRLEYAPQVPYRQAEVVLPSVVPTMEAEPLFTPSEEVIFEASPATATTTTTPTVTTTSS